MENLKSILELVTLTSTVFGVITACMVKWMQGYFVTKNDYKQDKEESENLLADYRETIYEQLNSFKESVVKEKADQEDFLRTERKVEKLDNQITELARISERQSFKLDSLISNRDDLLNLFKEFKTEIGVKFQEIHQSVTEMRDTQISMQLDIQELKGRVK